MLYVKITLMFVLILTRGANAVDDVELATTTIVDKVGMLRSLLASLTLATKFRFR